MHNTLLYYVAVPCTEEVINLITFFSIKTSRYDLTERDIHKCGLFIYHTHLELENVDAGTEWILENKDAIQVLAFYADKDFNGLCAYLNTLPERLFNVYINSPYLT